MKNDRAESSAPGLRSGIYSPKLIAHRGAMAKAPENTAVAFDAALSCNVDGIECDVQLTADGVPVIFHDDDILRITGQSRSVQDYTLDRLSKLDYGRWFSEKYQGTGLLRLEDVIRRYAHKTHLMIELKTGHHGRADFTMMRRQLAEKVLDMITDENAASRYDHIHLLSFDPEVLLIAHNRAPVVKTMLNLECDFHTQVDIMNDRSVVKGYGVPFVHLDNTLVRLAHDAGKKIMTYPCNTAKHVAAALEIKADFILTDDPAAVAPCFFAVITQKDRP